MMKIWQNLFNKKIQSYQKYLENTFDIDPKKSPTELLKQLTNQKTLIHFIEILHIKQQNGIKLLRMLTILHWSLFHQPELCDYYAQLNIKIQSTDQWMNTNILKPYLNFVYKITSSYEIYVKTKKKGIIKFQYELLFYITNLLAQLFQGVKKMSNLARYYKKSELKQINCILDNFVDMNACHAQELYSLFKIILHQIIKYPKLYIKNKEEKVALKYLIDCTLLQINQNMKNLLLDKYFFPYNKGYAISLLKIQELNEKEQEFVDKLLFNEELSTKNKRIKDRQIQNIIFDQYGNINPQLYQSLKNIRFKDQSIQTYKKYKNSRLQDSSFSESFKSQNADEIVQDV